MPELVQCPTDLQFLPLTVAPQTASNAISEGPPTSKGVALRGVQRTAEERKDQEFPIEQIDFHLHLFAPMLTDILWHKVYNKSSINPVIFAATNKVPL